MMTSVNSLEIEVSPISGRFARSGTAVNICIYRPKALDENMLWTLEVVSEEGKSRIFDDLFPTDHDAFTAFYHTIERDGIQSILKGKSTQV